jgi:hypothetical protein
VQQLEIITKLNKKTMNVFLIDVQTIKDNSYLDNNIDDKTIKIALLNCQEQILEPAIGSALYEKLLAGIDSGNLSLNYQNLIVQKMFKLLIHGTLFMVARNLLFRYTNSAIVQDGNQNSTAIDQVTLETLRTDEEIAYKHHLNKLKLYLLANVALFPEYYQLDTDGLQAEKNTSALNFYYDGPEIF